MLCAYRPTDVACWCCKKTVLTFRPHWTDRDKYRKPNWPNGRDISRAGSTLCSQTLLHFLRDLTSSLFPCLYLSWFSASRSLLLLSLLLSCLLFPPTLSSLTFSLSLPLSSLLSLIPSHFPLSLRLLFPPTLSFFIYHHLSSDLRSIFVFDGNYRADFRQLPPVIHVVHLKLINFDNCRSNYI